MRNHTDSQWYYGEHDGRKYKGLFVVRCDCDDENVDEQDLYREWKYCEILDEGTLK